MTLRRLGWAAALGLIVALASVVFYGAGKTHICPVYLWVLFDSHEAITTLSPGGLFGGRMAAPPGRHRPGHSRAEVFYAIHDAAGCWATTQRGYHCCRSGCQDMLRRHVVAPGVLSLCMHFSTSFLVNTSGRARGCCCGGVLRGQRWDIGAAGPTGVHKLSRHTPRSRPLFWSFLLLSISLLCCLFCIVSQATKILFFSLRLSLVYR